MRCLVLDKKITVIYWGKENFSTYVAGTTKYSYENKIILFSSSHHIQKMNLEWIRDLNIILAISLDLFQSTNSHSSNVLFKTSIKFILNIMFFTFLKPYVKFQVSWTNIFLLTLTSSTHFIFLWNNCSIYLALLVQHCYDVVTYILVWSVKFKKLWFKVCHFRKHLHLFLPGT